MDQPNYDLAWLYNTLSAAGAATVTWIFSRRKQKAEVATNELENVDKAIAIWRGIASDLEGKFTALQKEVIELQKHVLKLELENQRLKETNTEFQREIEELRKQIQP